MQIIPSIIPRTFEELEEKIKKVEGLVSWAQIDNSDGGFSIPTSWPYTESDLDEEIARLNDLKTSLKLELHLMIQNPEGKLDEWIDTPAKRIFIHHEAAKDEELDLTIMDMSKLESGLALNFETKVDVIDAYIKHIDPGQLMGTKKLGRHGEPFQPKVLEKIKAIKAKYPKLTVNVDGGVNESTIRSVKDAGADNAIAGSAIWYASDVEIAIKKLNSLIQ